MNTNKMLKSLGVPPLLYEWAIEEAPFTSGQKVVDYCRDLDNMLKQGKSICFNSTDSVLNSRLAVYVLQSAIIQGYLKVRYTTPEAIGDSKADSWEGSDLFYELVHADLVVIDRIVFAILDGFREKSMFDLIEKRLLNKKSTLVSSADPIASYLPERIITLFRYAEVKLIK